EETKEWVATGRTAVEVMLLCTDGEGVGSDIRLEMATLHREEGAGSREWLAGDEGYG
ncbi:hypothetical protein B296_00030345, partial [Ensete ventricosum]